MRKFSWGKCVVVWSALVLAAGGTLADEWMYVSPDSGEVVVFDDANPPERFRQPETPTKQLKGGAITWSVTYQDVVSNTNVGFDDTTHGATRQAAVDAVLNYISNILAETTGAVVDVRFSVSQTDGMGFLASAGPFYNTGNGFSNGTAWEHITTGVDPSGAIVDISSTFDFGHTYLNDHTQTPSGGQNDLFSVLLHEMTHGLGIASAANSSGNSLVTGANPGRYTVWDQLMRVGLNPVFDSTTTEFEIGVNASTFVSDNLFFSGSNAAAAHGSNAPIYAPTTFASGSSLSHFKTGFVDSVMEHIIVTGVAERDYSDVDLGALVDIGYSNVSVVPAVFFDSSTATVSENAGSVTVNLAITLDPGATESVTIATADGTAVDGVDYT
ncbi:MAG: Calx-beta domain-containing protein, partial [Candidatus Hydrogenedentales bacterium]